MSFADRGVSELQDLIFSRLRTLRSVRLVFHAANDVPCGHKTYFVKSSCIFHRGRNIFCWNRWHINKQMHSLSLPHNAFFMLYIPLRDVVIFISDDQKQPVRKPKFTTHAFRRKGEGDNVLNIDNILAYYRYSTIPQVVRNVWNLKRRMHYY